MDENPQKPNNPIVTKWSLVSLAGEFGFIIAIPLVVFALAGKWADAKFGTFPWITLAGILIAIISTTIWMTKRLKGYIK
ncbi:MAG: AtpZ/AtpI family protein [Candidatus Doudnabacteria bacterium]|nr:AtpZ/AtpI family protein [Candidatus Doudnabacteria bacterium]